MILRVKAIPNASQSEVVGWEDMPLIGPVLKVRIKAPPVEGKANKEIALFLAQLLRIPKSKVRLTKGISSRIKTFEIPDDTATPEDL